MSFDSEKNHRSSFGFRQQFSRLKDKVKEKAIRRNLTIFTHYRNLTTDDSAESSTIRSGFRQQFHQYKQILKNKTHYEQIKTEIKDKFDEKFGNEQNRTYPKGFYDSIFSPESENEVYFQTAIICLWSIALLAVIPTLVVTLWPKRRTSSNMIFFHVFLCELSFLFYIFLAMINVFQDFKLTSLFCDIANYGMYVTLPILQIALLFLSLERLVKHGKLTGNWTNIFKKAYTTQFILIAIWIILLAVLSTFFFIRQQFSFSFVKDQVENLAPPVFGQAIRKFVKPAHHCSVDGRLSTVFKTAFIVLFVILIVKPIIISLSCNFLTPCCCKNRERYALTKEDRRTTRLVMIFMVLNLLFSFPFYLASMFYSVLTRIDQTKETFDFVFRICFLVRVCNVCLECISFYTMEANSWSCISKMLSGLTCKKSSSKNDDLNAKSAVKSHSNEDSPDEEQTFVPRKNVTSKETKQKYRIQQNSKTKQNRKKIETGNSSSEEENVATRKKNRTRKNRKTAGSQGEEEKRNEGLSVSDRFKILMEITSDDELKNAIANTKKESKPKESKSKEEKPKVKKPKEEKPKVKKPKEEKPKVFQTPPDSSDEEKQRETARKSRLEESRVVQVERTHKKKKTVVNLHSDEV